MAYPAGTTVTYNGITLKNVLTLEFEQSTRRDPSGTDKWFSAVSIQVLAILNPSLIAKGIGNCTLGIFGTGLVGSNTDAALHTLICKLSEDRKDFTYSVGGSSNVVEGLVSKNGPDFDNGPKVTECRVIHINTQTVHVIFGIRLAKICCDNSNRNPIINHRWSLIDDIDESYKTTRVWRGLVRIAPSNSLSTTINPHSYRSLCFPPLVSGFKRKRMNFASSVNGLELAYEIVDEEMLGQAAPWPATSMHAVHSETVGLDATFSIGDCYVRLDGPKGANKRVMIERAMQIIEQKFLLRTPTPNSQVLSIQIVDHIGEGVNAIEVKGQIRHTLISQTSSDLHALGALVMQEIGKPLKLPSYKDQQALLLGPYGTASFATLFACFLQDPCNPPAFYDNSQPPSTPEDKKPKKEDKRETPPEVSAGVTEKALTSFGKIPYNADEDKGIYTFAQIDTSTRKNSMKVALPVALNKKDEKKGEDTLRIIKLGSAVSHLVVRIALERHGNWPKILKDADFTDSNKIKYTLLHSVYGTPTPKVTQDGQNKFHAIDAEFEYAMSRALKDGETFPVSSLPWDNLASKSNKMPKDALLDTSDKKGLA